MQNGVFLHTKEDVNTGCLETLFLITLFKFNTDMIDDFKGRHYWSTSQTSPIDCKSRMNKSFFFLFPLYLSHWERDCTIRASVWPIWVVLELNHLLLERKPEQGRMEQWLLNVGGPWGVIYSQLNPITLSFFTCENSSIYSLISGILLQIACLCWSPQHDKVQEWLFYRKSASCAASRLSLQSAMMEWWMLWQIVVFFFSPPPLPVDMPPWLMLILCYSSCEARSPY